jgi:hypothetical protein
MKGWFWVHFTRCWLWNFYGQVLRLKMGFVCRILKHGRWAIMREKMGMNKTLNLDYNNWRMGCIRKFHVLSFKKTFDKSKFTWKISRMFWGALHHIKYINASAFRVIECTHTPEWKPSVNHDAESNPTEGFPETGKTPAWYENNPWNKKIMFL